MYLLFRKHLKEKDYFSAFKLASGHPFLEELEEYDSLVKTGELFENNTQKTFNGGDYYDAVKLCDILSCFPAQKEFAEGLKHKANIYAETMQYYAEKQFSAVYNMIEEYPYLGGAKISVDIEKGFIKYYEKAEDYAASGDVEAVKKVMEKFSKIKSKQPAIYHLVKIAYWAQIEKAAQNNTSDTSLQEAFNRYQKIFGYESMLDDLLKTIQQFRDFKVTFDESTSKTYTGSVEALAVSLF